jgi:hypothetical protein
MSFERVVLIQHAQNQALEQWFSVLKTPLVCNIFSPGHDCESAGDTALWSRNQLMQLSNHAVSHESALLIPLAQS